MSETYYLLAAISYGIFIVQFILSWFGGDTDLDVDLDGELDMDVSDIVSFKGLVHFVIALICGILFVVILYYLYKLCLKLQHQVIPEEGEALIGRVGIITVPCENHFFITIEVNGGSEEIVAYPEVPKMGYMVGTRVVISKFENGKYYFN